AENLQKKYPGLIVVGTHDGYFKDSAAVAQEMKASGAELAFVCLGAPKQELWMREWGEKTGAKLLMGLGGSLDVFAGVVNRAPEFYCKHNLEWFYRLIKNPSRVGRMMKLPLFLVHVKKEKKK
ncbi:MAG: WecB/TagA/CpsF family glycosyltransferase, partial [Oscillospiraceae bacterium]|nr:WecB/TagA/CpsF family glycosyltransferase [Oscillospiraceae bacterium]